MEFILLCLNKSTIIATTIDFIMGFSWMLTNASIFAVVCGILCLDVPDRVGNVNMNQKFVLGMIFASENEQQILGYKIQCIAC